MIKMTTVTMYVLAIVDDDTHEEDHDRDDDRSQKQGMEPKKRGKRI